MIWLLAVLYRVLRVIGEKAGIRFEGRLSAGARKRALDRIGRVVEFEGTEVSIPEAPCSVRVELRYDNGSSARIEVVGVNFRMGRSPTGGTVHRLTWSAAANGPPPADLAVSALAGEDGEGDGRVAFDAALPAYECLTDDPDLWLDGNVRFRARRVGRARFDLGEIDVPLSPVRVSLDAEGLSADERERLADARAAVRERLASDEPGSVTPANEDG